MSASQPGGFEPGRPFLTLLKKEILRFLAVASQTLAAPLVTSTLYLLIFGVSLGSQLPPLAGFTYIQFIVPGLILMGVVNNSFANVSSSLFVSRYMGNIADLLVTPLSTPQFVMAYTWAAMLRGFLVGGVIAGVSLCFTSLPCAHPLGAFGMLLVSSFMFAQFGILAAIYATNFDTLSMYTNFIIQPLVYLGGLFYPVSRLPSPWSKVSMLNPLYYLIEGFRGAMLGVSDVPLSHALLIAAAVSGALFLWTGRLVASGYKLRS